MRNLILLSTILFLFCSCAIKGDFKGLYSYYEKTQTEMPHLFKKVSESETICNLKNENESKVYIVNGQKIRQCLKSYENAIVYIWRPRCTSEICYPLSIIQKKCNERGIPLFIIAEYYDGELMNESYMIEKPIFGIDVNYYKTGLTAKYKKLFLKDLIGNEETVNGHFLKFNYGNFESGFDKLNSI